MRKTFFIIFSFLAFNLSAQLTIKSGNNNAITKYDSIKKIDSLDILIKSDLETSSSTRVNRSVDLKLYAQRDNLQNLINVTYNGGELPDFITIERKSSAPLAEYRTVCTLTNDEILKLKNETKLILTDKYPESRQLDTYYRVKYHYGDELVKLLPGTLLVAQKVGETATISVNDADQNLFKNQEELAILKEQNDNKGITIEVHRNVTKVEIKINGSDFLQASQKISIERKGTEPLATFRKIRDLTPEEITTLITTNELFLEDKYPMSMKLTCYYRIVVSENAGVKAFPEVMLEGLRAN